MNIDLIRKIDIIFGKPIIWFLQLFKSKKNQKPRIIKRILLTKYFGFGNIIMISASFEQIRKEFPDAEIDFLTLKVNKPVIENYDFILDNFFFFDISKVFLIIPNTLKLIYTLRKRRYDVIIDFDQFARYSAIIAFLSKSVYSIGFKTKGQERDFLLDKAISYDGSKHAGENFNSLITDGLLISRKGGLKSLKPILKQDHKSKVEDFLKNKRIHKFIIVHGGMGENARVRKWPNSHFSKLINLIFESSDLKIVLTASPSEKLDHDEIIKEVKLNHRKRLVSFFGVRLELIPSLIERAEAVITSDTGILHIASSLEKKIIAPFGPTTPQEYGPLCIDKQIIYKGFKCSPCITNENCKKATCKDNQCMKSITPEELFSRFKQFRI